MEAVYFTIAGIGLYFLSDIILDRVEQARGARFKHRSLIFFGIIFVLAALSFAVIRHFTGA